MQHKQVPFTTLDKELRNKMQHEQVSVSMLCFFLCFSSLPALFSLSFFLEHQQLARAIAGGS